MTRSIWIVSLLLFAFNPLPLAAQPAFRDPHIRSLEPELLDDLGRGGLRGVRYRNRCIIQLGCDTG